MHKFIGLDTETVKTRHTHNGETVFVHDFYSFQLFSEDYELLNNGHFKSNTVFSTNPEDFLKFLTTKFNKALFVTFNLAFDGVVICRMLKNRGFQVSFVLAGSRIIRMTIRRGKLKWVLMDLKNLLPIGSLEKVGEVLKIPKMGKPSYLGERKPESLQEKRYFEEYAIRDAEICFKGAKMVYEEFGVFKTTCAGLAIRVFRGNISGKPEYNFCAFKKFGHLNDSVTEKFRFAYHGGRTECFIRGVNVEDIGGYDINSLYPYVMQTKEYPFVMKKYKHKYNVDLEYFGLANCTVKVDDDFPLLCTKKTLDDGIEKLVFPNGTFQGWFTYAELKEMENSNTGKIVKVNEAYEWQNDKSLEFKPFKKYVDYFYAKKQQAVLDENPKVKLYKIMLNGLYGKFGEHGAVRFLNMDGDFILSDNLARDRKAWYHSVVLAAYITAYARIENWKILKNCNPQKLYYTDTDSFYTSENLKNLISKKIGALKIEDTAKRGRACFIRSKFYMFNDDVIMKGFQVKEGSAQIKMSIYENDFIRAEHRILKTLEAKRLGKIPLTDCQIYKEFSVEEDGKRQFQKHLTPQTLLFERAFSKPLILEM